ncbi:MAG: FAD-dependent monooxygenase [Betaproteobacteria bacterium]|nr:FAD-dependent monooxygenase [Betaproteobacteria bacterium]
MSQPLNVPDKVDVAVAGSGLVAHAAALALAQRGLSVALVGPQHAVPALDAGNYDARVFALNAESRGLLQALKAWPAQAAERVQAVERMRVHAQGGQLSFDAYSAAQPALAWIVESSLLQQALQTAAAFHPTLHRVAAPALAAPRVPGGSRIEWPGGALTCTLLVVADAACVPLIAERHAWDVHDYHASALVGTLRCERPHQATAWQWFDHRGDAQAPTPSVLALLPLAGPQQNFCSLVWSTPEASALAALSPAMLADQLAVASAGALGELMPVGELALWPLRRKLARQVRSEGVVLVGDVAHTVHPLAGQGLNLALQDVQVLAQVLGEREGFRSVADARLLRRYARSRAEQTAAIATLTHGLWQQQGIASSAILSAAVKWGMSGIDQLPWVKREMVRHAQGTGFVREGA